MRILGLGIWEREVLGGEVRDAQGGILYGGCGVEGEVGSGLAGMVCEDQGSRDPREREGGGKEKRVGNAQAINFKKWLEIPMV